MNPANPFEQNSEEIQEIIGQIPNWIVRWGISTLVAVFVIFVFSSYYIRFPDTFETKVMINSKEQPFKMGWFKSDGLEYLLMVKDAQKVKQKDTLVVEHNLITNHKMYVKAPIDGAVYLVNGVENNPKKSILIIYPPISKYNVQLSIPTKGAGRTHKGQKVLIRLDNYPSDDFGFIVGEIESVVPVLIENYYRADVKLPNGLVTSTGARLPIQHFLLGRAEIVLEDKNLFQRIFSFNK